MINQLRKISSNSKFILLLIVAIALSLRLFNLNWDQGNHLHPDERMISMVTPRIGLPYYSTAESLKDNIIKTFSPDSPLNPNFFAYGSFPIYLLKVLSLFFGNFDPGFLVYDKINLLGRVVSAVADVFTVILIYKIALNIFKSFKTATLAAFIYALSVLPIQLSHFYAVDTLLNFFIFLTLYFSLKLYEHFTLKYAIFTGVSFGLSLATKVSATVLVFSLGVALIVAAILSIKKEIFGKKIKFTKKVITFFHKLFGIKFWNLKRLKKLRKILVYFVVILLFAGVTFVVFEPFAIFDFHNFWRQINEQSAMTKDAFVFPYTLQYVNTTPYFYQIKDIILWGLGPAFGLLSFLGFGYTLIKLIKGLAIPGNEESEGAQLIIFSFFIIYFLVVGNFSVKFMRYCLPLYPLLVIFLANLLTAFDQKYQSKKIIKSLPLVFFTIHLVWLFAFMNIYTSLNTRVLATNWINNNIPPRSVILREHWDDALPLAYKKPFMTYDLPLYDSDSFSEKWIRINALLNQGDYLVVASNRLYAPLQKLTECDKLPAGKCYYLTATYYQNLFSGNLGYVKVAEFTNNPSFLGFTINDQSADESFTVYDHPKIMIFKKQSQF